MIMQYKGYTILHHFCQYKVIIDLFTEYLFDTEEDAIQYIDANPRKIR